MMFYHDGLRIITAEHARHSSKTRAPLSDFLRSNLLSTKANVFDSISTGEPQDSVSAIVLCNV